MSWEVLGTGTHWEMGAHDDWRLPPWSASWQSYAAHACANTLGFLTNARAETHDSDTLLLFLHEAFR